MSINLQINQIGVIDKGHISPGDSKEEQLKIENAKTSVLLSEVSSELEKSNAIDTEKLKPQNQIIKNAESEEEKQQLKDAMSTISEFLNIPVRSVNFAEHEGTNKTVIKIFDSENQELIKQFPSEEILSIAQRIVELQQDVGSKTGILLDENI